MSGPRHGRNEGGHSIVSAEAGTAGRQATEVGVDTGGVEGREKRKEYPGEGATVENK